MKGVLFPTDFSENSRIAWNFAVDFAKRSKRPLCLLHVIDIPLMAPANFFTTRKRTMAIIAQDTKQIARDYLHQLIEGHGFSEDEYSIVIREGSVQNQILKLVKEESAQLLIIGTKGKTADSGIFMGSMTKAVIRRAECPVLAIPEAAANTDFSKIVYATDLKDDETTAIENLIHIAKLYDAAITIVHIDHDASKKMHSINSLKKIADKAPYDKISFEDIVVKDVLVGIERCVKDFEADMLAMATHYNSIFDRLLYKSWTEQMLFNVHIPLLTFNRKKYDTIFLG